MEPWQAKIEELEQQLRSAQARIAELEQHVLLCKVDGCDGFEYCGGLCIEHFGSMGVCESEALTVARAEAEVFTLPQIDDAIRGMEERLADGQGDKTMAMCRLSLPMTHWLRKQLHESQRAVAALDAPDACYAAIDQLNHLCAQPDWEYAGQVVRSVRESLVRAFVQGAKWWEWTSTDFTMWQSDQQRAHDEATEMLEKGMLGVPRMRVEGGPEVRRFYVVQYGHEFLAQVFVDEPGGRLTFRYKLLAGADAPWNPHVTCDPLEHKENPDEPELGSAWVYQISGSDDPTVEVFTPSRVFHLSVFLPKHTLKIHSARVGEKVGAGISVEPIAAEKYV